MSRPAPPDEVWVDLRLVVRMSPIEGRGLFAVGPVPEGTVVIRLGGRLVTTDELDAMLARAAADPDQPFVDTLTVYPDSHLVLPPGTAAHFVNHRCDPTLWPVGPYEVATRRPLRAGDEATADYGTLSGAMTTMLCRYRADRCRGVVTAEDWRRPELQRRYGDHWTPALLERIRADDRVATAPPPRPRPDPAP